MQQVMRALMHAISPLVHAHATQQPSTAATTPAATAAAGPQSGRVATANTPAAPASSSAAATGTAPHDAVSTGGNRARSQRPLGMSEPLSEMLGPASASGDAPANSGSHAQQDALGAQGLMSALMGAGASSVNVSGPMLAPGQHSNAQTPAVSSDTARAEAAAATASGVSSDTAEGNTAGGQPSSSQPATAGMGKPPGQRAVGLGSALPLREKGSKKSHPRSPVPGPLPSPSDQAGSSRQGGSRPAPSAPQQDNVKRARHGDSNNSEPQSVSTAGVEAATAAQAATTARAGREEEGQASRGTVQAGGAGGMNDVIAQVLGGLGGGGAADGSASGALDMSNLMQVCHVTCSTVALRCWLGCWLDVGHSCSCYWLDSVAVFILHRHIETLGDPVS